MIMHAWLHDHGWNSMVSIEIPQEILRQVWYVTVNTIYHYHAVDSNSKFPERIARCVHLTYMKALARKAMFLKIPQPFQKNANHSGREVYNMNCLCLLEHWHHGFEFHSTHRCLFAFILCLYCTLCK